MARLRFPAFSVRSLWREIWDALVSLALPAACRICEATLDTASRVPICRECLGSLRPLSGLLCEGCGRPFVSGVAATARRPLCHLCRRDVYAFTLARSYGVYDGAMVRAVTLLKYHAVVPLGGWFAARLGELVARQPQAFAADVVVPVPPRACANVAITKRN